MYVICVQVCNLQVPFTFTFTAVICNLQVHVVLVYMYTVLHLYAVPYRATCTLYMCMYTRTTGTYYVLHVLYYTYMSTLLYTGTVLHTCRPHVCSTCTSILKHCTKDPPPPPRSRHSSFSACTTTNHRPTYHSFEFLSIQNHVARVLVGRHQEPNPSDVHNLIKRRLP